MNRQTTSGSYPLFRLLRYAKPYRAQIIWASVCSVLNKLFDLAPPILIGMAVDIVVEREGSLLARWGVPDLFDQLWVLAGLTILVWMLESLFEYLFALAWRNLAQTLQHKLRIHAYGHVQALDMVYFEDQSTGELMSILNDDINQLERFLDSGANDILQILTTVILIGALFFYLAPEVAWMAILPMPFIIWGSFYWQKRLEPKYTTVRHAVGTLNSLLSNNLGGVTNIKSFTKEEHELSRVEQESNRYRRANRDAIRLSSAFIPLIRTIILAGFTATLVYGGQLTLTGQLEVGVYSVMIFMTQRLLSPLTRLGQTLDLYQRAMASTTRVMDLLDTQKAIHDGSISLPVEKVQGEITLENLGFSYREGPPVLHQLSLKIPAKQTIAIVGATGAGKSTLIKLLLRFYDPKKGSICLDGHPLSDLRLSDLRHSIGLVSQDVFLFHGTVRENIAYGALDAKEEEVFHAAKVAEAHDFIQALPQGYDTVVGERGQKLSGGQRQRISIARALLKDPPVLILDEATSSVDNETEAAIQRSLEHITVGRTTILIAHRLSTVRNADCIYVLKNGMLEEEGKHDELIKSNGIYAGLWQVQTGHRSLAS